MDLKVKKSLRTNIVWKTLLVTSLLSLLPILILSVLFAYSFFHNWLNYQIDNSYYQLAIVSKYFDESIRNLHTSSSYLITDSQIRIVLQNDQIRANNTPDGSQFIRESDRFQLLHNFFNDLSIMNPTACGFTLISNADVYGSYKNGMIQEPSLSLHYKSTDWYKRSLELSGAPDLINQHTPFTIKNKNISVISVTRSLFDAYTQDYLGTLIIDIDVGEFSDIFDNFNSNHGSVMLMDNDKKLIFDNNNFSDLSNFINDNDFSIFKSGYYLYDDPLQGKMILNYYQSSETGWYLLHLFSFEDVVKKYMKTEILLIFTIVSVVILMLIGFYYIMNNITKPIVQLNSWINQIGKGDLNTEDRSLMNRTDELGQLSHSINTMQINLSSMLIRLTNAIEKQKEAQIKALQSQINPHFILNTLNSIQMMAQMQQFSEATKMLERLGGLFKYYIRTNRFLVSIREERDCVRLYTQIQSIRFNDRVVFVEELDDEILSYATVKFVCQPIVENAIQHGVEKQRKRCTIRFGGNLTADGKLELFVEDSVGNITEENLKILHDKLRLANETPLQDDKGIGLLNVHNRIKLFFGDEYGLHIDSCEGSWTRVTIIIPAIKTEDLDSALYNDVRLFYKQNQTSSSLPDYDQQIK